MARLTSDLRFALRQIMRSPGFAVIAIITLALAIGANTAIFTLLNQALLRALPVKDPNQLVVLSFAGSGEGHKHSEGGDSPDHDHYFSYPMYRDLRDNNTVLSGLIATAPGSAGVSWNNHAEQVPVEMVSGNYFRRSVNSLRLGRLLLPSDETFENANPVAVLSFDYWKSHLAEAPVTGKTLLVNGHPFTIAGVAAPGFRSMVWNQHPDLYVPITMQPVILPEWSYLSDHRSAWLTMVGRLRPGETPQHASASLNLLWLSLRTREFALPARPIRQGTRDLYIPLPSQPGRGRPGLLTPSRRCSHAALHHDGHGDPGHGDGGGQCRRSTAGKGRSARARILHALCPGRNRTGRCSASFLPKAFCSASRVR